MTVDKFGHFNSSGSSSQHNIRTIERYLGFTVDSDGNININSHRIKNIEDPIANGDAISKSYLEKELAKKNEIITKELERLDKYISDILELSARVIQIESKLGLIK